MNIKVYPQPTNEELLVEYQAAQNSAQHHDALIWSINSVVWSASLILLGLLLNSKPNINMLLVVISICILGISLIIKVWVYTHQLSGLKREKYKRCKEIEKIFGFQQHSSVTWKPGRQWKFYSFVMGLFIVVWVVIAVTYFTQLFC